MCKQDRGGFKALRMPFDNFGGLVDMPDGSRCSVLKLVVDAVAETQDFTVFASKPLELMVEYKWANFGRYAFYQSLIFYLLHLTIIAYFNTRAVQTIHVPALTVWGYDQPGGSAGAPR
jgi:hypothetical protein